MTDFTTATPIHQSRISLPGIATHLRPTGFRRAFGSFGRGIVAVLAAYGRALEMAYAAPFSHSAKGPGSVQEDDLEGRDPNW